MRAKKELTVEDIQPFIERLKKRELTRRQLAQELGVCLPVLNRELKKLPVEVPAMRNRLPLHERLLKLLSKEELETLSQYDIAKQLQVTQPGVATALKKLGLKRVNHIKDRDARCEQVVNHIIENGGYVESTIRKLGINIYKNAVYDYCKERDIDLRLYRFAHQRYGHWLTLPCVAERCHTMDYRLQAECTKCGTVHTVQIVNLRSGASTQCRACADKERSAWTSCCSPVYCVETMEKTRSVRTLAKQLGVSYTCLLRLLKKDGQYAHDGLTYKFVDRQ